MAGEAGAACARSSACAARSGLSVTGSACGEAAGYGCLPCPAGDDENSPGGRCRAVAAAPGNLARCCAWGTRGYPAPCDRPAAPADVAAAAASPTSGRRACWAARRYVARRVLYSARAAAGGMAGVWR